MRAAKTVLWATLACLVPALSACGDEGAPNARVQIRETNLPRVKELIREDVARHRAGITKTADRVARGFIVERDPQTLEREMRFALRSLQEPPRGIGEFIASPMSFLASVGMDGVVIARDSDEDTMKGLDFGLRYATVRAALEEGRAGHELAEFPGTEEGAESSYSMIFVAPSVHDGRVVGAVVAGIPLWRWAQRLSRQLRVDHAADIEEGLVLWVYLRMGDRLFHFDTSPDLDDVIIAEKPGFAAGFERSPAGFTGEVQLMGRWYGYGAIPAPSISDEVDIVLVRADKLD